MNNHPLQNWIPYKLTHNNGEVQCHWLNSFNKPYTEPFFDETIAACKSLFRSGIYRNSVSSLDLLVEWASGFDDEVQPTAFIFHVSRCGSTMLSQLLGMNQEHISLAEVPIFDDILRLPYKADTYSEVQIANMLKASLKFYGQLRTGKEKHLFIKMDSWHILFYNRLRRLYPDVPFILLYRKPDEVLHSHTKLRGIQAVPGLIEAEIFGFKPQDLINLTLDEYTAKVLERYYETYIEIADNDKLSLLMNYNEGIIPMIEQMAHFSNFNISQAELLKMRERAGYHSKHPGKTFSEELPQNAPVFLDNAFKLYNVVENKRLLNIAV